MIIQHYTGNIYKASNFTTGVDVESGVLMGSISSYYTYDTKLVKKGANLIGLNGILFIDKDSKISCKEFCKLLVLSIIIKAEPALNANDYFKGSLAMSTFPRGDGSLFVDADSLITKKDRKRGLRLQRAKSTRK